MTGTQTSFDYSTIGAPDTDPFLYVASALSHLKREEQGQVSKWCNAIERAATEAARSDAPPWNVWVHLPIVATAPWKSTSTEDASEIYKRNSGQVWRAAGLIVLGYRGGSLGAGQEFAWAISQRLPILYLGCRGEPISRQIRGTPGHVTFEEFDDIADIERIVATWILRNADAIRFHDKRLRDRMVAMAPINQAISERWAQLDREAQHRVVVETGLKIERIQELASDQDAIALASLDEIHCLAGGLGLDIGGLLARTRATPLLDSGSAGKLEIAAAENGWGVPLVLQIYREAEREMLKDGVRRMPFNQPSDWVSFARRKGLAG